MEKKVNKITKYTDLSVEIQQLWNIKKVRIIPIIIGSTGVISKTFEKELKEFFPVKLNTIEMQKICLLGTARIIRRFNQAN